MYFNENKLTRLLIEDKHIVYSLTLALVKSRIKRINTLKQCIQVGIAGANS